LCFITILDRISGILHRGPDCAADEDVDEAESEEEVKEEGIEDDVMIKAKKSERCSLYFLLRTINYILMYFIDT
jgi:hypothetical protein